MRPRSGRGGVRAVRSGPATARRTRGGGAPRAARASAGQATVELALLIPLVFMGLMAVVQTALVARDQIAVVHAAREAARAASVDPDPARASAAAREVLGGADVEVGRRPRVGEQLRVSVRYRSRTDLPLVGPLFPDPVLRAAAVMRVER